MQLKLWHSHNARSLRALWTLEELGLDYQLVELPFPSRLLEKSFLQENVLGTVPYFTDGATTMTESTAICQYLADRYGGGRLSLDVHHSDYGDYLNWLHHSDATLTFPQTLVLRYAKFEPPSRRIPQVAEDYRKWFIARLKRLDQHLQSHAYLCAERFTIADIAISYALYLGHCLGLSDDYSGQIRDYMHRQIERDAFTKSMSLTTPNDVFTS